jgi:curved DNA-binding protein CbpA
VRVTDILIEAFVTSKEEALKILGLDDEASFDDVKSKYRKLAMTQHPDTGGDEEEFKKINAAKEVLSKALSKDVPGVPEDEGEPREEREEKAREKKEERLNETQEALFVIAGKIRQRILSLKSSIRLKDSSEWHKALAKAFIAASSGLSVVKDVKESLRAINNEMNKAEIEYSKGNLPHDPNSQDKINLISEEGKEINSEINDLDELIREIEMIDEFLNGANNEA